MITSAGGRLSLIVRDGIAPLAKSKGKMRMVSGAVRVGLMICCWRCWTLLPPMWQAAEMFVCTMCGHFDHNIDGNIVYGNRECCEIVGYPYCKKFTPWISASVRLPEERGCYLVAVRHWYDGKPVTREAFWNGADWLSCEKKVEITPQVTHWQPLPELPKEGGTENG